VKYAKQVTRFFTPRLFEGIEELDEEARRQIVDQLRHEERKPARQTD
jgi:hypothetical protein